ncbi:YfhO family protein [Flammeovirga sp. EKP202]|uniref:YfhO family protein n=1 Tax=Flammeovirga sp. EKP202 TaxID=2770592 RepID=UPI00165FB7C3|nr:YfhO family protein [Flammeovirga sp. EKP202]MBD0401316.1 YfhO family protein [Flammeovirga sp. EKP202]
MSKGNLKKYSWLLVIPVFFILTVIYFSPEFFDNKSLQQSDLVHFEGMSHASQVEAEKTGESPLWNSAMFSGMPELLTSSLKGDPTHFLYSLSMLFMYDSFETPMTVMLLMLGVWIGLMCFRVNPWVAAFIAAAFSLNTFYITSLEAGHVTKLWAIGYGGLILGSMRLIFDRKFLLGGALMASSVALELRAGHYQITYYLCFVVLIYGLSELYFAFKNGELNTFLMKVVPIGILAASLGASTQLWRVWTTQEYATYSIRGQKELSALPGQENNHTEEGLDKDYAFSWSEGKMESLTLLAPNFFGGSSQERVSEDGPLAKQLEKVAGRQQAKNIVQNPNFKLPLYFGEQPYTGGPIYQGVLISFFFILGLFVLDARQRSWLIGGTLITLMFAWGKHLQWFNYTLFDILPGMNKFRTPAMALGVGCIVMALGAALGLSKVIEEGWNEKTQKAFLKAGGTTLGLLILMWIGAGMMDVSGPRDAAIFQQMFGLNDQNMIRQFTNALDEERISLMRADVMRSIFFLLAGLGAIFAFSKKKLSTSLVIVVLGVLTLGDVWVVAKRYVNEASFQKKTNKTFHAANAADKEILKDKDPNYRVLNLTTNSFNESTTSYFHKSIGGYSAIKLRRYQDLIERAISREMQVLANGIQKGDTLSVKATPALNMLNMKYAILGPSAQAVFRNPNALGNAWFVDKVIKVNSADEEMETLSTINPSFQAIVDVNKYPNANIATSYNEGDNIKLTSFNQRRLKYTAESKNGGFAVFSEVWYPAGWVAKIDGEPVDIVCTNYILRGIHIPAGKHEITFDFDPNSFVVGGLISKIASYITLLLLFAAVGLIVYNETKK